MTPPNLTHLIDLLAAHRGRACGTLGRMASGSGDFYGRLKAGRDITTGRAARVAQWLSDRWPDDLDWPADIPRPAPSEPGRDEVA